MHKNTSTLTWVCLFFCICGAMSQGYGTGSLGGSNPFKTRADFEAEMGGAGMNPVLPPGEDQYFPPPEIPKPDVKQEGTSESTEDEEEQKQKKRPDCPVVGFSGASQLNTPDVKFNLRNLGPDAKIPGFGSLSYPGRVLEKSPKWEPGDETITFKEDQFVEGGYHTSYSYNPDCEPVEGSNVVSAHAKNIDIEPEPYGPSNAVQPTDPRISPSLYTEAVKSAEGSIESTALYTQKEETPVPSTVSPAPLPYLPPVTKAPYVPFAETSSQFIRPQTETSYAPSSETWSSHVSPVITRSPFIPQAVTSTYTPQTHFSHVVPDQISTSYATDAPFVPPQTQAPYLPPVTTPASYVPSETPATPTLTPYVSSARGSYGIENEVDIPEETTRFPIIPQTSASNRGNGDNAGNYGQSVKPSDIIDENEDGVEYVDELTTAPPSPPPQSRPVPKSQPIPVPRALPSPVSSFVPPAPTPVQAFRTISSYIRPLPPASLPQSVGAQHFGTFQQSLSPVSYPQPQGQPSGCCGGSWFSNQGSLCAPVNYNLCTPPVSQQSCQPGCQTTSSCSPGCPPPAACSSPCVNPCPPSCPPPCIPPPQTSCCCPQPAAVPNFCGGRRKRSSQLMGIYTDHSHTPQPGHHKSQSNM